MYCTIKDYYNSRSICLDLPPSSTSPVWGRYEKLRTEMEQHGARLCNLWVTATPLFELSVNKGEFSVDAGSTVVRSTIQVCMYISCTFTLEEFSSQNQDVRTSAL